MGRFQSQVLSFHPPGNTVVQTSPYILKFQAPGMYAFAPTGKVSKSRKRLHGSSETYFQSVVAVDGRMELIA